MSNTSTANTTYTLRAKFISHDGLHETWKTTPNLSLEAALEKKTQLLERVPHCVLASVTPDK